MIKVYLLSRFDSLSLVVEPYYSPRESVGGYSSIKYVFFYRFREIVVESRSIFKDIESDIANAGSIPEAIKLKVLKNLQVLKDQKINIMITGATGSGKSSTINALFDCEKAVVGQGSDPETMDISCYQLDNLVLWDSPGLGDGKETDTRHAKNITDKLAEKDKDGNLLIDLVLVILDGSSRDLGTSYELINRVIIPNLGEDRSERILVAINQADMAMKGRHWNYETNSPDETLVNFLDEKVLSVKRRVREATSVDIEPIYYSAGYKEGDEEQTPYNLAKLLYFIVQHTPKKKRLVFVDNTSKKAEMWENNDVDDYVEKTQASFMETITEYADAGGEYGREFGEIFGMGKVGETIGKVAGGVIGAVKSVFSSVGSLFRW